MIVEPCCYQKEFAQVFAAAQERGHASYVTFSDTTIQHLLNWLVAYMPMSHILIAMTSVTEPTMRFLNDLAKRQYYNPLTHQQQPIISSLDIIAQSFPDNFQFPTSNFKLAKYNLGFRAVLISTDYGISVEKGQAVKTEGRKFLVQGSLNQDIVRGMQMVTVTTDPDYSDMLSRLSPLIKLHPL